MKGLLFICSNAALHNGQRQCVCVCVCVCARARARCYSYVCACASSAPLPPCLLPSSPLSTCQFYYQSWWALLGHSAMGVFFFARWDTSSVRTNWGRKRPGSGSSLAMLPWRGNSFVSCPSLSLSLSLTHTHTHTLSLSLCLSLSLSLSRVCVCARCLYSLSLTYIYTLTHCQKQTRVASRAAGTSTQGEGGGAAQAVPKSRGCGEANALDVLSLCQVLLHVSIIMVYRLEGIEGKAMP